MSTYAQHIQRVHSAMTSDMASFTYRAQSLEHWLNHFNVMSDCAEQAGLSQPLDFARDVLDKLLVELSCGGARDPLSQAAIDTLDQLVTLT